MNPGSELDTLVAEKVMGWRLIRDPGQDGQETWIDQKGNAKGYPDRQGILGFCPSEDIAAAWKVIAHLAAETRFELKSMHDGRWTARFYEREPEPLVRCYATQESATHAICLAALKAVGAL